METIEKEHAIETRNIYEKQHARIAGDTQALKRIKGLYEENFFGLDPAWFAGKEVLDVGCGNIGALIARLHELNAKKIVGIDIEDNWIDKLKASLTGQKVDLNKVELKQGDHLDIPYENNQFDMVFSNGILIHLESLDHIKAGFKEAARVCKKDGYFYASFGPCGGLIQGAIFPAIRKHYRENPEFKAFIDNIQPKLIHQGIEKICQDAKQFADQDLNLNFLVSLFGEDFCVFLQNYIQAPTWLSNECTPEFVENLFKENGFKNVRRLHKYCKREDIRKFFAPLHYDINYPLSKILYGEGYVQYIGQKL